MYLAPGIIMKKGGLIDVMEYITCCRIFAGKKLNLKFETGNSTVLVGNPVKYF